MFVGVWLVLSEEVCGCSRTRTQMRGLSKKVDVCVRISECHQSNRIRRFYTINLSRDFLRQHDSSDGLSFLRFSRKKLTFALDPDQGKQNHCGADLIQLYLCLICMCVNLWVRSCLKRKNKIEIQFVSTAHVCWIDFFARKTHTIHSRTHQFFGFVTQKLICSNES